VRCCWSWGIGGCLAHPTHLRVYARTSFLPVYATVLSCVCVRSRWATSCTRIWRGTRRRRRRGRRQTSRLAGTRSDRCGLLGCCIDDDDDDDDDDNACAFDANELYTRDLTTINTTQRAVECYKRAATAGQEGNGHPDAWYNLGTIYYEGGPGQ
jgi:hypothetical protein